jgi:Holliday junction DNA helicase RuvA
MIDRLTGRCLASSGDRVVMAVGGVGLVLSCPPSVAMQARVGDELTLSTTLVVREDSLTLYGFATEDARTCFDQVQTVSGIGPRIALALLSVLDPDGLREAVATGDISALTAVPGIGKKGAERLVLELKDRLGAPPVLPQRRDTSGTLTAWEEQVHAAIVGLGWRPREADGAVAGVRELAEDGVAVADLLRAALRQLDRAS